jgi:hypothetical protein
MSFQKKYLTSQHQTPASYHVANGQSFPLQPLMERKDDERLRDFDIFPHLTSNGPAPLGYTPYVRVEKDVEIIPEQPEPIFIEDENGNLVEQPQEPLLPYTIRVIQYEREPIGTSEDIQAAIEAEELAQRETYLDSLECTRLQGKLALIRFGMWDSYNSMLTAMRAQMTAEQLVFVDDAITWKFRDPVLQAFATSMGMNEDQVIGLFETAKTY